MLGEESKVEGRLCLGLFIMGLAAFTVVDCLIAFLIVFW